MTGVVVGIAILGTIGMLLYGLVAAIFKNAFGIELPRLY